MFACEFLRLFKNAFFTEYVMENNENLMKDFMEIISQNDRHLFVFLNRMWNEIEITAVVFIRFGRWTLLIQSYIVEVYDWSVKKLIRNNSITFSSFMITTLISMVQNTRGNLYTQRTKQIGAMKFRLK